MGYRLPAPQSGDDKIYELTNLHSSMDLSIHYLVIDHSVYGGLQLYQALKDYISEEYYNSVVDSHRKVMGRPLVIPDYRNWLYWAADEGKYPNHLFVRCGDVRATLSLFKDVIDDEGVIPEFTCGEHSRDIHNMWAQSLTDEFKKTVGIHTVEKGGIYYHIVDLRDDYWKKKRRFKRYYKGVTWEAHDRMEDIQYWWTQYRWESALYYWTIGREYHKPNEFYDMHVFAGGGAQVYGLLVKDASTDGSSYSILVDRGNEMVHKFIHRTFQGYQLGTTSIYAACQFAESKGKNFLNMGDGSEELDWKLDWSRGNLEYLPGLRFTQPGLCSDQVSKLDIE